MQIGQVRHHALNHILIKSNEKKYLCQFVSEMIDYFQYDSTKCAPQCGVNSFVTMATYWVPDKGQGRND